MSFFPLNIKLNTKWVFNEAVTGDTSGNIFPASEHAANVFFSSLRTWCNHLGKRKVQPLKKVNFTLQVSLRTRWPHFSVRKHKTRKHWNSPTCRLSSVNRCQVSVSSGLFWDEASQNLYESISDYKRGWGGVDRGWVKRKKMTS